MNTIAERIKYIRKEYHLNQIEFAERIGVTNAHISRMEKRKTIPSESLVKLICKEFSINEEWLKNGTEPIYIDELDVDVKFTNATEIFNKTLKNNNEFIRSLTAELMIEFSKIADIEMIRDEMKILYLNSMISLFSIIQKYTMNIKNDLAIGQITIDDVREENTSVCIKEMEKCLENLSKIVFLYQNPKL